MIIELGRRPMLVRLSGETLVACPCKDSAIPTVWDNPRANKLQPRSFHPITQPCCPWISSAVDGAWQSLHWGPELSFSPGLLSHGLPSFSFTARGAILLGALAQMTEALRCAPATPVPCSPASDGAAAVNEPSAQRTALPATRVGFRPWPKSAAAPPTKHQATQTSGWRNNLVPYHCGHLMRRLTHWKRPWCWERLRAGGEGGSRGWDGCMASPTQRTWVWANSRRWWGTGKPGVLQSMGSQRVGHDWVTEQQPQWCYTQLLFSSYWASGYSWGPDSSFSLKLFKVKLCSQ